MGEHEINKLTEITEQLEAITLEEVTAILMDHRLRGDIHVVIPVPEKKSDYFGYWLNVAMASSCCTPENFLISCRLIARQNRIDIEADRIERAYAR